MIKSVLGLLLGAGGLYFSSSIGMYAIILMLVIMEWATVSRKVDFANTPVLIGMFLCEAYFLYTGVGVIGLSYFLFVSLYLIVRYKGNAWFQGNNVNGYLYLLFTLCVPIFLDFITKFLDLDMGLLPYVLMYLIFLRMSDLILKTQAPVLLFAIIQIISAYSLEKFMIGDEIKIYFAIGLLIWTIFKLKVVSIKNVSRLFDKTTYTESREGLH